ncbi:MAG: winged helix-turn-helix domain-containing protein [Burkholderiaceae bacterium]
METIPPQITSAPTAMTTNYHFGHFELQPNQSRLLFDGQPVELGQRAFDVLSVLVEHAGQLVTKDQLLGLVWPGMVVEENNLQVQVSTLRKILGTTAIATTAGRGYRFTLELTPGSESSSVPDTLRHNLPSQLTSFIGHEVELEEYAALLEQTRLITLTGIGGCGKTRLALKLAERVLSSFPDGVWFVDLAPLSDAQRLPMTVASTLGVRQQVDRPPIETLCEHLATRRALILLDNCEHLKAACADLTQRLLGAATNLHLLVTSREGLSVPGERSITVRSLELPAIGSEHDLAELGASEAVRLFVERARWAAAKFSLDAATAPAVLEICRRLDGIPLAIELAAARAKVLSVDEIRTRLDDRFRLLTRGGGAALGRQQTLLATIQWSYDHLSPDEQWLLRRLSVFVGGWTLAAAVRVIEAPGDEYRVLDLLTGLVDRSLLTLERLPDGATRYAVLETVRQYAQDRVNELQEGDAARDRHAEYFLELAEEVGPEISGPTQGPSLALLKAELENLLQAMTWCDHAENGPQMGMRLAQALLGFWLHAGLGEVGYRQTVAALEREGPSGLNRARLLIGAGYLGSNLNRQVEANEQFLEALSIAREIDDRMLIADSLRALGFLASERGEDAAAMAMVEEALAIARVLQDDALVARALNSKGEVYRTKDDMEAAQPLYEEALSVVRAGNNLDLLTAVCDNLARVYIARREPEHALPLVAEVLELSRATGSKWRAICAFDVTVGLAVASGDWVFAAHMRGAAEARVKTSKYARDRADEAFLAPRTQRIREQLGESAYSATFGPGSTISSEQALEEALAWVNRSAGVTPAKPPGTAQ